MSRSPQQLSLGASATSCFWHCVQVIRELPTDTTLALLTISGSVCVYHLRVPETAAAGTPGTNGGTPIAIADCFPGDHAKSATLHTDLNADSRHDSCF